MTMMNWTTEVLWLWGNLIRAGGLWTGVLVGVICGLGLVMEVETLSALLVVWVVGTLVGILLGFVLGIPLAVILVLLTRLCFYPLRRRWSLETFVQWTALITLLTMWLWWCQTTDHPGAAFLSTVIAGLATMVIGWRISDRWAQRLRRLWWAVEPAEKPKRKRLA
jgi:hypothetical protein